MTILVSDVARHVSHAIGGGKLSPELSVTDILNEAGEHLIASHPWKFRERAAVTLDFVADTSYVLLPSDFSEILAYNSTSGLTTGMQMTTHQDLVERRTTGLSYPWVNYVAVTYYMDSNGVPEPRLEIWPTPSSSSAGELTLFYRSGWVRLASDSTVIPLPTFMRSLYYSTARAFAQGYEEASVASVDERLAMIHNGPVYKAAVERDAHVMPNYGFLQGGAVEAQSTWRNLDFNDVTDP